MKPRLIIVSAPSGAGKSTLCSRAIECMPELVDTITFTTRAMREGESEGNPYHFVSEEEFKKLRDEQNFFVEWAVVHGKLYGTPRNQLEDTWRQGKWSIMDVDIQGAATLKAQYPEAKTIFILPPSIDELRRRITARDKGKTPDLDLRLKNAEHELKSADKFEFQVVNDQIDQAFERFKKIIAAIIRNG